MKKLTIGRNNACDVIIPDTSDLVSRKQAVLAFSFWGKMTLYDTSNNGTYVNGQKLESGKGIRVTRKDKVSFARIADLDWNEVRDPYRKHKIMAAIGAALTVVLAALLVLWLVMPAKKQEATAGQTETIVERGETVTTVSPQETPVQTEEQPAEQPVKRPKKKTSDKKKEPAAPHHEKSKDVNDNSPIVY